MSDDFANVYADARRAHAYAGLEYPGTYYLAFRDLPALIGKPDPGHAALDFGCGAGRSTRFLRDLGFDRVVGVDISAEMVAAASAKDPGGDYRLLSGTGLEEVDEAAFDLIFSAFTFDNIPATDKTPILAAIHRTLKPGGRYVQLVSAPEIYWHEWTSFSTRDFPANREAVDGGAVHIVMLDVEDRRPVDDVFCTDARYRELFAAAGLDLVRRHQPVGRDDDPCDWVTETVVSPWSIYVLEAAR